MRGTKISTHKHFNIPLKVWILYYYACHIITVSYKIGRELNSTHMRDKSEFSKITLVRSYKPIIFLKEMFVEMLVE